MVQPFIDEVWDPGEGSLIFFGSRFSHAVRKRPAAADYRVQWEFGATAAPLAPPPRLTADAEAVMAAAQGHPLYARVDGVERDGRLMLMELELIEPHLFLGWDTDAPARLAGGLGAFVTRPPTGKAGRSRQAVRRAARVGCAGGARAGRRLHRRGYPAAPPSA